MIFKLQEYTNYENRDISVILVHAPTDCTSLEGVEGHEI
jgi:hypothetical protein